MIEVGKTYVWRSPSHSEDPWNGAHVKVTEKADYFGAEAYVIENLSDPDTDEGIALEAELEEVGE